MLFSQIRPNGPIRSSSRNVHGCADMSPFHVNFVKASHWPSDHMIRYRSFIGISELCILDENSDDLQSHDGFFDDNAEEAHNQREKNTRSKVALLSGNF